jgi:hypothetical protein
MRYIKNFIYTLLMLCVFASCKKLTNDDISFVNTGTAPADGTVSFSITNDNSGFVTITPNGTGAATFDVYFGDNTANPATVQPGKNVSHSYKEGTYTVKVDAKSANGTITTTTKQFSILYRAPESLVLATTVTGHDLSITAAALYASGGFKVYFGDVPNEVPTLMATGDTLHHYYTNIGNYTIKVTALSGGAASITSPTQVITIFDVLTFPINYESPTLDYSFIDFAGGSTAIIDNPQINGINTSAKVCRMIKYNGEVYGGSIKKMGLPIDFSSKKIFKIKVFSPRIGAKMLFKVENNNNSAISYEKEVVSTKANQWEEITIDFSAIDASKSYHNFVIIFDNGTRGDGSANYTFLFDDISLNN